MKTLVASSLIELFNPVRVIIIARAILMPMIQLSCHFDRSSLARHKACAANSGTFLDLSGRVWIIVLIRMGSSR